ncbi:MAG: tetratricopeptide repeat protein, partial [Phormidesmis sp. CAN_BIN44]|nr:tetratricopeptide repeat protein [Phormidesmis sp. CAN_BIN44]
MPQRYSRLRHTNRVFLKSLSYLLSGGLLVSGFVRLPPVQANPVLMAQTNGQAAEAKVTQGLQFIQQGRLNDAIESFRTAARLNPNMAAAHYNLG